jgi:bifunctional non-homologous end joining protein LigD
VSPQARGPGAAVRITHPEKVLFPGSAITKGDLAAYYGSVAPRMVPLVRDRPVTMERYPSGIGEEGFMQKNVSRGFPAWLRRVEVPKKGGVVNYPLIHEARDLLWMANQNCITPHVWVSRVPALDRPDICVFDLDPSEDDLPALRAATLAVRDLLAEAGLSSLVKTSGSKGFHVVVPLDGTAGFESVVAFAHAVATVLVARHPDDLTLEFLKADRGRRLYIDIGRNTPGATVAAPYAVRAKPGAPVSAPCTWDEVESGAVHPQSFVLRDMTRRLEEAGDLWGGLPGQALAGASTRIERLGGRLEVPVIRRFGNRA